MIRAASLLLAVVLAFPATAQTPPQRDWAMTIGAAAAYVPDYEGSDDHKVRALPYVDASYKDTVFFRGTTLGANLVSVNGPRPGDGLKIGPLIRYGFGRDEGDNEALRGLGDIDAAIELGGFARYSAGPWLADLQVAKDVAGGHEGVLVDAGIVVTENCFRYLEQRKVDPRDRALVLETVREATKLVGRPVFFS